MTIRAQISDDVSPIRLVASVVTRNELGRYQPLLVRHLLTYCDEIRVLDDSSDDGTADALDQIDPRVKVRRLMGGSYWQAHGEGIFRQQALEWTMEARPTHVLAIDADEFVPRGGLLRKAVRRNPDAEVFFLHMVEIWKRDLVPWQMRVDGGWAPHPVPVCWRVPLISREPGTPLPHGWDIRNDRLACGRVPEMVDVIGGFGDGVDTGCDIVHLGWSDPAERRPRYERYMAIDGGEYHSNAHLRSIVEPPELVSYGAYPEVLTPRDQSRQPPDDPARRWTTA